MDIDTFKVGPKNQRLKEASAPVYQGYDVVVESDLPLDALLEKHSLGLDPDEKRISAESFPWTDEGKVVKHFELFDFSFRSEYGRAGVDEAFVREKLDFFRYHPATLVDLLCFGGHFRQTYQDHWFEARQIIALGSVLTTKHVVRKKGLFHKEVTTSFRHYPELECVSGRPCDHLRLSSTGPDADGNWPRMVLFLATAME